MMRFALVVLLASSFVSSAAAQEPPPGEGNPHAGVPGAPSLERSLATAEPSAEVAVGAIRVRVVDEAGAPVRDAEVNVGTMGQEGRRDRLRRRTDATGQTVFADLATGTDQAYRVNLPFGGATYSSTPFQLPTDQGYDVRITRIPTTRDSRVVLQGMGQMMIELREGRLHITQQARLMNLGEHTFVFPAGGMNIELPRGFLAQNTEPMMTDQKLVPSPQGYKLQGSLPPGSVVLAWSFDLPLTGSDMRIQTPMPFRTYIYRVMSDAPEGMRLDVESFPPAELAETGGRRILLTQVERAPSDAQLTRLDIRLRGIPGPGPLRWIAVALASLFVVAGIVFAIRQKGSRTGPDAARGALGQEGLLAEIAELERQRRKGEVGPRYFALRKEQITTELALILKSQQAKTPPSAPEPVSSSTPSSSR